MIIRKRSKLIVLGLALIILLGACGKGKNQNDSILQEETSSNHEVNTQGTETIESSEIEENIDTEAVLDTEVVLDTEEEQKVQYTFLSVNTIMYALSNVNVRSGPSTDFKKIGGLTIGEEVSVIAQCNETGWYRILYDDNEAYVSSHYLSEVKQEVPKQTSYYDTGDAELNVLCDQVLEDIVNEQMSEREKAYAVYTWVTNHVKYRGSSDTSNWVRGAKVALTTYKGNCYAFYSASRALLTRLGFENTEAVAIKKDHYWNLIKVDGTWWHFDATTGWGTERFLWTSEQINDYRYYNEQYGRYIAYEWDQKGIPE